MSGFGALAAAVDRHGYGLVTTATYLWAGRLYGERGRLGAWREALAEVVTGYVTIDGVFGVADLAWLVVDGSERPEGWRDIREKYVGDFVLAMRALDEESGAPSSFPLTVINERDLADIAAVADAHAVERAEYAASRELAAA